MEKASGVKSNDKQYKKAQAIAAAEEIFAEMDGLKPSGKRLPAKSRKHQLIHEAREVFAERGYLAAGTKDIAERCGLSHGALFKHFPTKCDLFNATVQEEFKTLIDNNASWEKSRSEAGLDEELKEAFGDFIEHCESNPSFLRILLYGALQRDEYAKMFTDHFLKPRMEKFAKKIDKGAQDGEFKSVPGNVVAMLAWSAIIQLMVLGQVFEVEEVKAMPKQEVVDWLIEMVFRGIEKLSNRRFGVT